MSICLSPEELVELTQKTTHAAQVRELIHLGIPYKARRDGTLLVLRIHIEATQDSGPAKPQLRLDA